MRCSRVKRRLGKWCQGALSASGYMQLGRPTVMRPGSSCWDVHIILSVQNEAQWESQDMWRLSLFVGMCR